MTTSWRIAQRRRVLKAVYDTRDSREGECAEDLYFGALRRARTAVPEVSPERREELLRGAFRHMAQNPDPEWAKRAPRG